MRAHWIIEFCKVGGLTVTSRGTISHRRWCTKVDASLVWYNLTLPCKGQIFNGAKIMTINFCNICTWRSTLWYNFIETTHHSQSQIHHHYSWEHTLGALILSRCFQHSQQSPLRGLFSWCETYLLGWNCELDFNQQPKTQGAIALIVYGLLLIENVGKVWPMLSTVFSLHLSLSRRQSLANLANL